MNPQPTLRVLTASDPHALALSIRASCLVFEDAKSKALLERVQRIAPSEATALVIGETGTGKELIARHIHELSERRQHPFVAVNCAAISESLIESELFGHERGAFTGAVTARPDGSKRLKAARCSWMRSAICLCRFRRNCCASSRSEKWCGSARVSLLVLT